MEKAIYESLDELKLRQLRQIWPYYTPSNICHNTKYIADSGLVKEGEKLFSKTLAMTAFTNPDTKAHKE